MRKSNIAYLSSLLIKRRFLESNKPYRLKHKQIPKNDELDLVSLVESIRLQPKTQQLLTSDEIAFIDMKFKEFVKTPSKIIKSIFKIDLSGSDMLTLRPSKWLNDNIIDAYLQVLMQQATNSFTFTTQFYTKLENDGYQGVRRWAIRKKLNVFQPHYVFIPVNQSNTHWTLAVVNNAEKRLTFYDSMESGRGKHELKLINEYLKSEANRLKVEYIGYAMEPNGRCPQQRNGYDCGVFMCEVVHKLCKGDKLDHTQDEMELIRKYMAHMILKTN